MKPREFWIAPNTEEEMEEFYWEEATEIYFGDALTAHPGQGPLQWQASLIHVIEYDAYMSLLHSVQEREIGIIDYMSRSITKATDANENVHKQLQSERAKVAALVEAHERTVQIVRGLIDRLSVEGLKSPSTHDSHLFLVELVNCCKRSEKALAEIETMKGKLG